MINQNSMTTNMLVMEFYLKNCTSFFIEIEIKNQKLLIKNGFLMALLNKKN